MAISPTQQVQPTKRINVRNKGQRGEREVVKLLQEVVDRICGQRGIIPPYIQRNQLQTDKGGEDLAGLHGFSVEVKFQEIPNVNIWWKQCLTQATRSGGVPILIYRATHQPWKVKFRAYVATPGDKDQMEMDMTTSVEDFLEWFGLAFQERL